MLSINVQRTLLLSPVTGNSLHFCCFHLRLTMKVLVLVFQTERAFNGKFLGVPVQPVERESGKIQQCLPSFLTCATFSYM